MTAPEKRFDTIWVEEVGHPPDTYHQRKLYQQALVLYQQRLRAEFIGNYIRKHLDEGKK